MGFAQEFLEVSQRTVSRMDVGVIRDVVAVITQRGYGPNRC